MSKSILRIFILILLVIGIVGIFFMVRGKGRLNISISPDHRISKETLQLLCDMKNSDVFWSGTYFGIMPTKLIGASLLLLHVQEDINALLIDALIDEDKYVAAHVLLTARTSNSIPAVRGGYNGLKVQLNSDGSGSFDGNNLLELQKFWKEKLQQ
jgi:hypothetical protein